MGDLQAFLGKEKTMRWKSSRGVSIPADGATSGETAVIHPLYARPGRPPPAILLWVRSHRGAVILGLGSRRHVLGFGGGG